MKPGEPDIRHPDSAEHRAGTDGPGPEKLSSDHWYDLIVEASADGSWYWDIERDLIHCSPRLLDILDADTQGKPLKTHQFVTRLHREDRERHKRAIAQYLKGETDSFELEVRVFSRSGRRYWIFNRGIARRDGSGRAFCMLGSVVDITPRRRLEDSLRAVAASTVEGTGVGFFESSVRYLSDALASDVAFIGRLDPAGENRIDTLAVYRDGKPEANFQYGLADTPCEDVLSSKVCVHPGDVARLFPRDVLLTEEAVEAYIGCPMFDSEGKPIGIIVALFRRAVSDTSMAEDLLKIFAGRAASELERQAKVEALRESEQRFRDFTEVSSDWFWEMGPDLRFSSLSDRVLQATGVPAAHFIGKSRRDLLGESRDPEIEQHLLDIEAHRPFRDFIYLARMPGGNRYLKVSGKPVFDADGAFLGYRGTGSDVTEMQRARVMMRHRGAVLEMTARNAPLTEVLHEIVGIAGSRQYGLTAAIFRLQDERWHSAAAPGLPEACIQAVDGASSDEVGSVLSSALHGDREIVDTRIGEQDVGRSAFVRAVFQSGFRVALAAPIRDQQGAVLGVLAAFAGGDYTHDPEIPELLREMTQIASIAIEQERLSQALLRQAHYDALTGLPNRTLLWSWMKRSIHEAAQNDFSVGVLLLDLDDFKVVNDSLGHSAGDQLLQEVAERLQRCVRPGDTIARLGGDEFVLVVSLENGVEYCTDIAERLIRTLQPNMKVLDQEVTTRVSIGISLYPQDAGTPEALLQSADTAMYAAKNEGKNQYRYFADSMNRRVFERLRIGSELQDALENENLELHYQPRIELSTGVVDGAEALLRWRHPTRGLLTAGQFIEVAERSPLISEIDRFVLYHALHQLAAWQSRNRELVLSVNMSAKELHAEDFAAQITLALDGMGCKADGFELEITESMLLRDYELCRRNIVDLKERAPGLRIAIDDFGSGYSSLNYLRQLPIDTLKIDRSFISDLRGQDGGVSGAITKTIIELGHNLGLTVVAEGVELESQADWLRRNGCHQAQGFYYDKALPLEEFEGRLSAGHYR